MRKSLVLGLAFAWLFVSGLQCSSANAQFETAFAANLKLELAFNAKDTECAQKHNISVPVLGDVRREDIDRCIMDIGRTNCTAWGALDPTPDTCRIIQIRFG